MPCSAIPRRAARRRATLRRPASPRCSFAKPTVAPCASAQRTVAALSGLYAFSSLCVQGVPKTLPELGWRTGQPAQAEQLAVLREDPEDGARHLVEQHRPRIGSLADRGVTGAEELADSAGRREHPRADQAPARSTADAEGGPQALAHAVLRAHPRAVPGASVPGPVEQLVEPGADDLVVEQVVASRQYGIRGQGDRCLGGAVHGSPSVVSSGAARPGGSAAVVAP